MIVSSTHQEYSDDNCNAGATVWVPESFGNVNLVNGRVMPYVEVPPTQILFRVVNAANSRHYEFQVPFPNLCKLVCDFTGIADGTAYELVDLQSANQSTPYDPRVLQIRIVESLLIDSMTVREIPTTLNNFKSLKALYEAGGLERNVTLSEMTNVMSCPLMDTMHYKNKQVNISTIADALECVKGTVEKWNFINPTADPHPFHWHLVHVQCGDTEDTIKTNELKDVAVIPSAGDDFGFDTTEPYVAHCHILEHEENMMMSWFRIINDYRSSNSGSNTTSGEGSNSTNASRGSWSSGDGSDSPTVGSGSWYDAQSDIGSGSYSQAEQSGLPAKNVTYAQYHGFDTEDHRCDGQFNRHGMYAKTNGSMNASTYDDADTSKGFVQTAISSTVVNKEKQAQYGDASTSSAASSTQERSYTRTKSGSSEINGDNAESYIEKVYVEADSEVEDASIDTYGDSTKTPGDQSNTHTLSSISDDSDTTTKGGMDESNANSTTTKGNTASVRVDETQVTITKSNTDQTFVSTGSTNTTAMSTRLLLPSPPRLLTIRTRRILPLKSVSNGDTNTKDDDTQTILHGTADNVNDAGQGALNANPGAALLKSNKNAGTKSDNSPGYIRRCDGD
ncbi:unnamed protein product [Phytophthora lilii]|uniref:Unnamed protein product n=1 Tax=Phytophthora lilii TaxID=2077276 RepID=A0A9W6UBY6_9STRA|nr:unnamed protein product [Phytophthora lilii]